MKLLKHYILSKKFSCLPAALIIGFVTNAQDIHFSQFYEAPLSRNPALAGIFTGDLRIQGIHRDQWSSVDVPFKTSLISLEYKMPIGKGNDYLTTGSNAYHDNAGANMLNTTSFIQSLTYHKSLGGNVNRYLSIGFGGGYTGRKIDPSLMTFDNQYDISGFSISNPSGEVFRAIKRNTLELSTGISYNSAIGDRGNFFIGSSVWHLLKDRSGFLGDSSLQPRKWQFNGGVRTFISQRIMMHLETNAFMQGAHKELMAGGMISYTNSGIANRGEEIIPITIGAGAFVRLKDAIVPVIKAGYKNIYISLSMDLVTSKLKTVSQSRGGYELAISYVGFTRDQSNSIRQVRCPRY